MRFAFLLAGFTVNALLQRLAYTINDEGLSSEKLRSFDLKEDDLPSADAP